MSETLRARAPIDATDAPTRSTLRIRIFFSAVNTDDLNFLSLVRSVKRTLVTYSYLVKDLVINRQPAAKVPDYCIDTTPQSELDKLNKPNKTVIVMGSEGKGMRRLVEENCDISVKLPMSPLAESLNVATACAIALYEINK